MIETLLYLRPALGIIVMLGLAYIFSCARKNILWVSIAKGLLLQCLIALIFLYIEPLQKILVSMTYLAKELGFAAKEGTIPHSAKT